MNSAQMVAGIGESNQSLAAQVARARAKSEKLNLCPFGCAENRLDAHGYCRHVVGFTMDGTHFEPCVRIDGRFVVQVPRESVPIAKLYEEDEQEYEEGPPELQPVKAGDKLVWIGQTARVYREIPKPIAGVAKLRRGKKKKEAGNGSGTNGNV